MKIYNLSNGGYIMFGNRYIFYFNGKLHRLDGPAIIYYYENLRNIQDEAYYVDGILQRIDGPAEIYYYENKNIKQEVRCVNGKMYYNG